MFGKLLQRLRRTPQENGATGKNGKGVLFRPPELLCEIDPDAMTREEIRDRLAELYRRHNQAASSLNPELREEAEMMLEAIVFCREQYVDIEEE